ncbi:MAG: sugar phosphate isomerase/epimerase [Clostridia bacterium]|nr:sugar phosphate isomerase/epimerase [Clostridia bacterium]
MKIAFSTLGCPDWSWDEILATAKDMGYDAVEIRGISKEIYAPAIPVFAPDRINDVRQKLSRMDLKLSCLTSACYLFDKVNSEKTAAEGKAYIELADSLGIPYVRVLGDRNPEPGEGIDDQFVADSLKRFCEFARGTGVTVLIETNGVYADSERLLRLVKAVNDPKLGVLWDVHHPYRYFNETPEKTYENLKEYIRYLHVKDSVVTEDGKLKYRMMGYGDLPVAEALKILKAGGFDGYVTLEWVKRWYSELEEPGVVFMQYISYMRRLLRRL